MDVKKKLNVQSTMYADGKKVADSVQETKNSNVQQQSAQLLVRLHSENGHQLTNIWRSNFTRN